MDMNEELRELIEAEVEKCFAGLTNKRETAKATNTERNIVINIETYNELMSIMHKFVARLLDEDVFDTVEMRKFIDTFVNSQKDENVKLLMERNKYAKDIIEKIDNAINVIENSEDDIEHISEVDDTLTAEPQKTCQDKVCSCKKHAEEKDEDAEQSIENSNKKCDDKLKNKPSENFSCKIITKNGNEPAKEYKLTKEQYDELLNRQKKQSKETNKANVDIEDIFDIFDDFPTKRFRRLPFFGIRDFPLL